MDTKTITESYFVVGASYENGPVFLTKDGDLGARAENARRFADRDEASSVGIHDAKMIPAGKKLEWMVIHVQTTHLLMPA